MKIIDLLVEMSKGNYPDKFKIKDEDMIYHKVNNIYINEDGVLFDMYFNIFDVLNEEVEILGENMYVRTRYGNIAKIININDYREPSLALKLIKETIKNN